VRNQTIDIAKFLCLALMVFCHIPLPEGDFHKVVYSFHMPLFFLVGGLFYNPNKFTWKKGILTLIVPYLCFNLVIIGLNAVVSLAAGSFKMQLLLSGVGGVISGSSKSNWLGGLPSGPSWFLPAFFLVKISAKYVLKLNAYLQTVAILLPIGIVVLLREYWTWSLWSIDSAVLGTIFFYTAFYLKEKVMLLLDNRKIIWMLVFTLPLCCLSFVNGQADMYACNWGNNFMLYILFAFVGIFNVLLISKLLVMPQRVLKTFMDGSIFIICMNIWLIDYISLFTRKFLQITGDFQWPEKFLITAIVFAITYFCTLVILRVSPQLLGKKK